MYIVSDCTIIVNQTSPPVKVNRFSSGQCRAVDLSMLPVVGKSQIHKRREEKVWFVLAVNHEETLCPTDWLHWLLVQEMFGCCIFFRLQGLLDSEAIICPWQHTTSPVVGTRLYHYCQSDKSTLRVEIHWLGCSTHDSLPLMTFQSIVCNTDEVFC